MSVNVEFYKFVSRRYLHQLLYCSFDGFEDCFQKCWCCLRREVTRKEFEEKGFKTFNSDVKGSKFIDTVNCFTISPLDKLEAVSSEQEKTYT